MKLKLCENLLHVDVECMARACKATADVSRGRANTCSLISATSPSSINISMGTYSYERDQVIPALNKPCPNPFYLRAGRSVFGNGLKAAIPELNAFLIAFNWVDGSNDSYYDANDDDNFHGGDDVDELLASDSSSENDCTQDIAELMSVDKSESSEEDHDLDGDAEELMRLE